MKNAAMAKNKTAKIKKTKFIFSLAKALVKLRYLDKIEEKEGFLYVSLAFFKKEPVLTDIKLISKPGLRVYMRIDQLETHKKPSFFLVSTPKGVMDNKEAVKNRLGGEVIAEVF